MTCEPVPAFTITMDRPDGTSLVWQTNSPHLAADTGLAIEDILGQPDVLDA